jgi:hypothetical protein
VVAALQREASEPGGYNTSTSSNYTKRESCALKNPHTRRRRRRRDNKEEEGKKRQPNRKHLTSQGGKAKQPTLGTQGRKHTEAEQSEAPNTHPTTQTDKTDAQAHKTPSQTHETLAQPRTDTRPAKTLSPRGQHRRHHTRSPQRAEGQSRAKTQVHKGQSAAKSLAGFQGGRGTARANCQATQRTQDTLSRQSRHSEGPEGPEGNC